jgi:hypothetical protein
VLTLQSLTAACEDTTTFVDQANESLGVGSTALTGWTVTTGTLAWIGPTNTFGLTAGNGSYFLDLTDSRDTQPFGGVTKDPRTPLLEASIC